ncbi:methionine synthase [Prochlorococcus sp. MIT 1223]|uniref:methionine synthase n=1 Tax=Prochlorococcus sp. MIT 1223 TaxID=3096217 RepID=UPI002A762DE5|nr:methionine synthase [Prochlorococcus sp. MIT 1223]
MIDFKSYLNKTARPILVFDGATGTSLQTFDLTAEDFGGTKYEGCNENLVISSPRSVEKVHRGFLDAGCDIIETNTFGATSIVLEEYGLSDKTYEINKVAVEIAKSVISEYQSDEKPRFIAGSIGPTTKLVTLGHITFDELKSSYKEQSLALIEGGVDLVLIETCQDVLQIKAAIQAVNEAKLELDSKIPIMVSVTMETNGRMLVGTDISAVVSILQPFDIDILGLNCATGPFEMKDHIKYLSEHSPFTISCIPNAGLPENVGGVAHYKLTPIELQMQLMHFVQDLGVQLIGGCCGTTPEHIAVLAKYAKSINNDKSRSNNIHSLPDKVFIPSAASIYDITPYKQDNSFLIIGERLNASGSKKVRELLVKDDWDGLISIAKSQQKENAHILDVNVDYVGRDGVSDMSELVKRVVTNINLPLMLDSTDYEKMESGLKKCGGKCILNSTNYEDGPDRFYKVLELARNYGSGVVIGTIDEEGMARTSEKKVAIAKRAYYDATKFGIKPYEIFYDPLALPISTGIEEDRNNAKETLLAIREIVKTLPQVHIVLGISNISFGLSKLARLKLNSVFLNEAIKEGMDSAIVSPNKILPLSRFEEHELQVCLDLIYDKRRFENKICTYDPLTELTSMFDSVSPDSNSNSIEKLNSLEITDRLRQHIVDGERIGLEENLNIALKNYSPLDIINKYLLEGMKVVGELFGSGQMQLPFVLQSAETMKHAVSFLEPFMEKIDGKSTSKGKFLIATVKGDVHDIGKNLVDIILSNNGYEVINLGIKQEIKSIISAQQKYGADCIAMSGLLVKSTAFMKTNLEAFNESGINVPVILGGAALTPGFVNKDCNDVYKGKVIYGKDAFTDLRFMESYMEAKNNGKWDNIEGFIDGNPKGVYVPINSSSELTNDKLNKNDSLNKVKKEVTLDFKRSKIINPEPSVKPPFVGTKILIAKDISLTSLIHYLDKQALFSGQWQMKRMRSQSKNEYDNFIATTAEPILSKWINIIEEKCLVNPSAIYGYFPCGSINNSVELFDPQSINKIGHFDFPRQKSGKRLCISDYYIGIEDSKPQDIMPMQAVTMGSVANEYSKMLFNNNQYTDYLYFHGLSVQLAEALAEYVHSIIRRECGFGNLEPKTNKDILSMKYRGCRYSFGYPACPNVSDSRKQLEWLNTERIGLTIDSSDQLHPEQSTTAIVSLHSQAKYFSA